MRPASSLSITGRGTSAAALRRTTRATDRDSDTSAEGGPARVIASARDLDTRPILDPPAIHLISLALVSFVTTCHPRAVRMHGGADGAGAGSA